MIPESEDIESLINILRGEQFAKGSNRIVYHVNGFSDLVMKVSISEYSTAANWCEYLVSSALRGRPEPVAELFGDVKFISPTGKYLIMERLNDLDDSVTTLTYPNWLSDRKDKGIDSAFGVTATGKIKIRDYGMLNLANILALETYRYEEDIEPRKVVIPDGHDQSYANLLGEPIGTDLGRYVHQVKGYPNHVIKVCMGSHKPNRVEFLIYGQLSRMHADECESFGALECSRSGKYLLMERLNDLPANFTGSRPNFPNWLVNTSDACIGVATNGDIKIRSYSDIRLGDVLAKSRLAVGRRS